MTEQKVNDFREMDRFNREAGAIMAIYEKDGDNTLNDMLSLEAFASIEDDFNTALVSIENSAQDANLDGE